MAVNTKKRSMIALILAIALITVLFSVSVNADTQVNVTMEEIVYQNVTFAEDFYLNNQQKSCMVEGTINVTNPSEETVFDIYLLFRNVDKLTTDFFHTSGRNGSVIQGGAGLTLNVSEDITNTTNDYEMPIDLNDDGGTDYAYVNSTHFLFNLSNESGLVDVSLSADISNAGTSSVSLNVDEAQITGERNYGNITIQGTAVEDNTLNVSNVSIDINEYLVSPIVMHIPELRWNDSSEFIYNMSCMGKKPPVTITTNYTNDFHPDINRKVLAGHNWTLNQTVANNNIGGKDITNLNITMATQSVDWNGSQFYFNFSGLDSVGDYTNVNRMDNHYWWWAPSGGTLTWGDNVSIRYNMTAPFSVPSSATYMALLENITYSVNYLLTNLSLDTINASADITPDFEKRIYKPADNEQNHNVTWEITPYVSTDQNITYDLNKVTMWVTHNMNPQNYTGINTTYNNASGVLDQINKSDSWGPEVDPVDKWYFNYTDGSNASNPPPIVWIEPEWLIANKNGQIKNFTKTISGEDLYMKYVYVVNGYWLQIDKNITNIGEGQYRINTTVQNIGNGWTPEYEEVTVYDFVPKEFQAYNFTVLPPKNETVGTDGSDYRGQAYVWDIPWKDGKNSSLGPMRGPNATGYANYTWSVEYTVNGSGQYKVTELYVVGLDPQKVDGAFASPIITVISSIQSHTNEVMYIGIIGFLIVLNVTNLIITNRINHKISRHMPAPPPKKHHPPNNGA